MFTHNLLTQLNLLTRNLLTHNLLTHTLVWHLATSTFTLRGRRGTGWHLPSVRMASVALMALGWLWRRAWVLWSPRLFAWQAWHLATSTFTLRGRRGTWWHRPSLCVAGVALMALDWLWWRAIGYFGRRGCLRGRRGTWRHRPSLCVAGVALMALGWLWRRAWELWSPRLFVALGDLRFAWQAWCLWHWTGSGGTQNSSTLSHTTLSHTTLSHTTLSHTTLSHTALLHTALSHTTLSHTTLLHTQTYTHTHNSVTHSSFTQPVLHHLLSFLPFPSHFHICLWSLEEVDLWGYPVL